MTNALYYGDNLAQAQIEAFEDIWHGGRGAESAFDGVMRSRNTVAAVIVGVDAATLRQALTT